MRSALQDGLIMLFSGKSILMDMLAMHKTGGSPTGSVLVNGVPQGSRLLGISAYVAQVIQAFAEDGMPSVVDCPESFVGVASQGVGVDSFFGLPTF